MSGSDKLVTFVKNLCYIFFIQIFKKLNKNQTSTFFFFFVCCLSNEMIVTHHSINFTTLKRYFFLKFKIFFQIRRFNLAGNA